MKRSDRMRLCDSFARMHQEFSLIEKIIEQEDDPEGIKLYERMFEFLSPMRKLRLHFAIPYVWQEPLLYRVFEPFSGEVKPCNRT